MIEQDIGNSGGALLLNSAVMLASNKVEVVLNHKRYIRSGFVETDLTGLDPSVIKSNSYFENLPPAPGVYTGDSDHALKRFDVGKGIIIFANSGALYRSSDFGVTWQTISLAELGSEGYCTSLTTDGNGKWWGTYNSSNANVIYSDDDGQNWSVITSEVATKLGTANPEAIQVNKETGTLILFSSPVGTNDDNGKILRSTDGGVTWVEVDSSNFGYYANTRTLVCHGNGNWLVIGGSNASGGFKKVRVSYDDGATWSNRSLGWDTGINPDDSIVSRVILNGLEYWIYVSDNENAEGRQHITCAVTEEGSGTVINNFYIEQELFPFYTATSKYEQARFIHHEIINGVVYFANGIMTEDCESFFHNGNAAGHEISQDNGVLFVRNTEVNRKTIFMAKDAAGSVFPYSEGSVAQYIVITE